MRKFYPHILEDPEIIYIEHLILDFYEDRIEKLGICFRIRLAMVPISLLGFKLVK